MTRPASTPDELRRAERQRAALAQLAEAPPLDEILDGRRQLIELLREGMVVTGDEVSARRYARTAVSYHYESLLEYIRTGEPSAYVAFRRASALAMAARLADRRTRQGGREGLPDADRAWLNTVDLALGCAPNKA